MTLVRTESFDWLPVDGTNQNGAQYLNIKHNKVFSGNATFVGAWQNDALRAFTIASGSANPHGNYAWIGSQQLGVGGTGVFSIIMDSTEEDSVIYHGFRYRSFGNAPTSPFFWLQFMEYRVVGSTINNTSHVAIRTITGNANSYEVTNATGAVVATFTTVPGVWSWIEIKIVVHDTAGSIEIRINNFVVVNVTNIDTRNNASFTTGKINGITFVGATTQFNFGLDDMYVCNSLGSFNNNFLGDITVGAIKPTAAGTYTQWTPSVAPNWDCVNDVTPDTTDYVSSQTVDQRDSYNCADVVVASGYQPLGVMVFGFASKMDTGGRGLAILARANATDKQSVDRSAALTTDPVPITCHTLAMDQAPDNTNWTQTSINSLEVGVVCRP